MCYRNFVTHSSFKYSFCVPHCWKQYRFVKTRSKQYLAWCTCLHGTRHYTYGRYNYTYTGVDLYLKNHIFMRIIIDWWLNWQSFRGGRAFTCAISPHEIIILQLVLQSTNCKIIIKKPNNLTNTFVLRCGQFNKPLSGLDLWSSSIKLLIST